MEPVDVEKYLKSEIEKKNNLILLDEFQQTKVLRHERSQVSRRLLTFAVGENSEKKLRRTAKLK
jgi:hypothetical protein